MLLDRLGLRAPTVALALLCLPLIATPAPAQEAAATGPNAWLDDLGWRSIGPANMGGRIVAIAVHPDDTSTFWVGTASGGILKTTNAGTTYEHQFDDETTVSIGHLAVAPSNPDVVWVGTGEANPRNSVSYGDGVYKSTDGGATWQHMGLEDSFQIGRIAIHPDDENTVYVGALGRLYGENEQRGLYKTTDGGETWERVLFVDERTGVTDVDMHPTNPDVLIVATYERQRDEFDTNQPAKKWGPGSGLWRTTDGGSTWTRLTEGLPSVEMGRIGVDWYRTDPKVVYAVIETERIGRLPDDVAYMGVNGEDADVGARLSSVTEDGPAASAELREGDVITMAAGERVLEYEDLLTVIRAHKAGETIEVEYVREGEVFVATMEFGPVPPREGEIDPYDEDALHERDLSLGLGGQRSDVEARQGYDAVETGGTFRSDDGGVSWKRINSLNPRPMYYSQIRVDPSDDSFVYVLGTRLHRSSDGGDSFTNDGAGGEVHVDHHALWIDPNDGRHMILGNDGGIYVTHDRMENWDHHNHVAIGQFYRVTTDAQALYNVYGGLQDNGSWGGPNRTRTWEGVVNTDWMSIGGGDGFVCKVDENDPDQIYYESQNGFMNWRNLRTGERGWMRPRAPEGEEYRFNWNTPFLLSNHNSRIVYAGGNHVFRSLDRGNGMRAISPELTLTDRGSATALDESPRDEQRLYVGTDDGAVWTTRDGGETWIDLWNPAEPVEGADDAAPEEEAPITGAWSARVESVRAAGELALVLALDDAGALVGGLGSQDDDLRPVRYFEGDGSLALSVDGGGTTVELTGTVVGAQMTGWLTAWDGALSVFFRAQRTEAGDGHGLAGTWRIALESDVAAPGTGRFELSLAEAPAKAKNGDAGDASSEEGTDEASDETEGASDDDSALDLTGRLTAGSLRVPVKDAVYDGEARTLSLTLGDAAASLVATRDGAALTGSIALADLFDVRFAAAPAAPRSTAAGEPLRALVPKPMWVSDIVASRHATERVYLTLDGHRSDDDAPWVFVSEDGGDTWRSIAANLPRGSTRAIFEDGENPNLLFVGTEFGAYMSFDRGGSWMEMGRDLPTVAVHEFAQHEASGDVVAATHGRSLWILDTTVLRQITPQTLAARAHLYRPADGVFWRSEVSRGDSGTRRFIGENPSAGVDIAYSLGRDARSLALTIEDLAGEVVRTLEAPTEAGLHRVPWNLRREGRMTSRGFMRSGPPVPEGEYVAVLEVDGERFEQRFRVVPDPDRATGATMAEEAWFEDLERFEGEQEEEGGDDEVDLDEVAG